MVISFERGCGFRILNDLQDDAQTEFDGLWDPKAGLKRCSDRKRNGSRCILDKLS